MDKRTVNALETDQESSSEPVIFSRFLLSIAVFYSLTVTISVQAQVKPDSTLGDESSRVTTDVPIGGELTDRVDGGAIRESNLFHSFSEFNVTVGQRVYFANPDGIDSIISRVTGTTPSDILGTLGVDGGADLFLFNPNGIAFGPNSIVDVSGSFYVSTAEAVSLGEEGVFSAIRPEMSRLLSISSDSLFLNQIEARNGMISTQGTISAGEDLTLSAGELNLQGQILAGQDLTFRAAGSVIIRDSLETPFVGQAEGQIIVEGEAGVDIFALNNPVSSVIAGEDLILRSVGNIFGDARFWSGGNFRIEQLDGQLASWSSPNDAIILANGNVSFSGYSGESLHILAGGSVTSTGTITITGAGNTDSTINPIRTP